MRTDRPDDLDRLVSVREWWRHCRRFERCKALPPRERIEAVNRARAVAFLQSAGFGQALAGRRWGRGA